MHEVPRTSVNPALMRAALPEMTEYYAEIENYPYDAYSKSTAMTLAQTLGLLMQGFSQQAVNLFDTLGHPIAESASLAAGFAKAKGLFDRVATIIPDGNAPDGVTTLVGENLLPLRRAETVADYFKGRELALALPNLGIPLGTRPDSPFQVLTGDDVRTLSAETLDRLLARGAILDVPALAALWELGQGERIGIKVGRKLEADEVGFEEYNFGFGKDFAVNHCRHSIRHSYHEGYGNWHELESDSRAEAWSIARNFRSEEVASGLLMRENAAGERFGVIAFTGDVEDRWLINCDRARQMRRAFAWVAKQPLPLAATEHTPYCWIILNRDCKGRLIAGVVNCSTDRISELPLLLGAEFALGVTRVTEDGETPLTEVREFVPDPDGTGATVGAFTLELAPLEFAVLRPRR